MADDDLRRMTRVLRHRLRNIASGVRGAVTLIGQEGRDLLPPELNDYFPLIAHECSALLEVADRLHTFWAPAEPVRNESAELLTERVIREVAALFPNVAVQQHGHAEARVSVEMESALRALVINACEAAPGGGAGVAAHQNKTHVIWTVFDSGPGVPDELRDSVFLPFFTTRPRHLGLGLSWARRLAHRSGGDCTATTDSRGSQDWSVQLSCSIENNHRAAGFLQSHGEEP